MSIVRRNQAASLWTKSVCQFVVVGLGTVVLTASSAFAADAEKPHPHQGVIPHFEGAPPIVSLTADESAQLDKDEPVRKQIDQGTRGRGVAVFRVNAPVAVVWSVISDFPSYAQWIDNVKDVKIYKREGDDIWVDFKLSSWGVNIQYYIKHHYPIQEGWGTWTLDYTRTSDLDDSVGYWRVTPVPGKANQSQVEYSVDLAISGWVPGFIKNIVVDKGLAQATSWVKVQAEKRVTGAGNG